MTTWALHGRVTTDRPLLVVAVDEEAAHLRTGSHPVLVTGAGKVNAATALATVLAAPVRPSSVVNLGTAGALRAGWTGLHEVARVVQHDLDDALLERLTGRRFGPPVDLAPVGPVLATGDVFVADRAVRARLAESADLVDMEGYAVARVAVAAGVPVRLVKHVSDDADERAGRSWVAAVEECARVLAGWVDEHLR